MTTPNEVAGLIERLRRTAYRREERDYRDCLTDVPCEVDDLGAEEYFINPDGPEAADALEQELTALSSGNEGAKVVGKPKQLEDLRTLLDFPALGPWGRDSLIDTLNQLLPELRYSKIEE